MQPIPRFNRLGTPKNRQTQEKQQSLTERTGVVKKKDPLLLIILLNKKTKQKIHNTFFRLKLFHKHDKAKKIMGKYLTIFLKYHIKANTQAAMNKIQVQSFKKKNIKVFMKIIDHFKKSSMKMALMRIIRHGIPNLNQQKIETQKKSRQKMPMIPSAPKTSRNSSKSSVQLNRSVGQGDSTLKNNIRRKIDFDEEQIALDKIKKQNQALKIMQLSQEARVALKKVQRFDRFIYAQETQKVCKDILTKQLKRLQKIKNSNREMRVLYYDNELTITALYNHIKLISEMNRDLGQLKLLKQVQQKQEILRKELQFKASLQKRKANKSSPSKDQIQQKQIRQLTGDIQKQIQAKNMEKSIKLIDQFIKKYEKDENLKQKIYLYRTVRISFSSLGQNQKFFQDCLGLMKKFQEVDNAKDKMIQKQLSALINKVSKNEENSLKEEFVNQIKIIYESFSSVHTNNQQKNSQKPVINELNKKLQKLNEELVNKKKQIEQLKKKSNEEQRMRSKNKKEQRIEQINDKLTKILQEQNWNKELQALKKNKMYCKQPLMINIERLTKNMREQSKVDSEAQIGAFNRVLEQGLYRGDKKNKTAEEVVKNVKKNLQKKEKNDVFEIVKKNILNIIHMSQLAYEQAQEKISRPSLKKNRFERKSSLSNSSHNISKDKVPLNERVKMREIKQKTEPQQPQTANIKMQRLNEEAQKVKKIVKQLSDKIRERQKQIERQKIEKLKLEQEIKRMSQNLRVFSSKLQKKQKWAKQLQQLKNEKKLNEKELIKAIIQICEQMEKQMNYRDKVEMEKDQQIEKISLVCEQMKKQQVKMKQQIKDGIKGKEQLINKVNKLEKQLVSEKQQLMEVKKNRNKEEHLSSSQLAEINKKYEQLIKQNQNKKKLSNEESERVVKQCSKYQKELSNQNIERMSKKLALTIQKINQNISYSGNAIKSVLCLLKNTALVHCEQKNKKQQQKIDINSAKLIISKIKQSYQKIKSCDLRKSGLKKIDGMHQIKAYPIGQDILQLLHSVNSEVQQNLAILTQNYAVLNQKYLQSSSLTQKMIKNLRILQNIVMEKGEQESQSIKEKLESMKNDKNGDQITLTLVNIIQKIGQNYEAKVSQVRKSNQKSLKSYQNQIEKITHAMNELEKDLAKKDQEYRELYYTFTEMQKNQECKSERSSSRKSKSLRNSRRSLRNEIEQKETDSKLRASIDAYALQEKKILQRYSEMEIQNKKSYEEKQVLTQQNEKLQQSNEQLKKIITQLQTNLSEQYEKYQSEYQQWKKKSLSYNEDIKNLKENFQRDLLQREQESRTILETQKQELNSALELYKTKLSQVQQDLNTQIKNLQQKLRMKEQQTISKSFSPQIMELRNFNMELTKNITYLQTQITKLQQKNIKQDTEVKETVTSQQLKKINERFTNMMVQLRGSIQLIKERVSQATERESIEVSSQNELQIVRRLKSDRKSEESENMDEEMRKARNQISVLTFKLQQSKLVEQQISYKIEKNEKEIQELKCSQKQKEVNQLRCEVQKLEHEINSRNSQIELLHIQIQGLNSQISGMINKDDGRDNNIQIETLRHKIQGPQSEVERLNGKKQTNISTFDLDIKNSQLKDKDLQIQTLKGQIQTLNSQIQKLKEQKQTYQSQKQLGQELKQTYQQIQTSKTQIQSLNCQIKTIKQQNQTAILIIEQKMNDQVQRLTSHIGQLNSHIDSLNTQIQHSKSANSQLICIKKQKTSLKQQIQCLQTQIRTFRQSHIGRQQLQSLECEIRKLKEQQNMIIENEVKRVLNEQQNDFNIFMNNRDQEREKYFYDVVIPQRIRFAQTQIQIHYQKQNQEVIKQKDNLSQINEIQKAKIEQQQLSLTDYRQKLRLIEKECEEKGMKLEEAQENMSKKINLIAEMQNNIKQSQKSQKMVIQLNQKLLAFQQQNNSLEQQKNALQKQKNIKIGHLQSTLVQKQRQQEIWKREKAQIIEEKNHLAKNITQIQTLLHKKQSQTLMYRQKLLQLQTQIENLRAKYHIQKQDYELRIKEQEIASASSIKEKNHQGGQKVRGLLYQFQQKSLEGRLKISAVEEDTLKMIMFQVGELTKANRKLQNQCILLKNKVKDGGSMDQINFFTNMQDKMEQLINFLVSRNLIQQSNIGQFIDNCHTSLKHQNFEGYFRIWINFMKNLFLHSHDLKSEQLRQKASEMLVLKERMNEILEKQIQFSRQEEFEQLQKYRIIFTDIKFFLREYLQGGDQEYLQMLCKSLAIDELA